MTLSANKWMAIAARELGVREIAGNADNPRIVEYHAHTGLKATDDETAWCSAFANWVMDKAGIDGSNQANARSWLGWGRQCEPKFGAVCVLWRGVPSGWQGHVAFLVAYDDEFVWLLGGNQSDSVNVAKYPRSRVLGFRFPLDAQETSS